MAKPYKKIKTFKVIFYTSYNNILPCSLLLRHAILYSCVCIRLHAHTCTCRCIHVHVESRTWHWASSLSYSSSCCLRQDFSLSLEFTNSTREQGMFLSVLPLSWDYSALLPTSIVWMLRRKLRSSYLPNKYLKDWVISSGNFCRIATMCSGTVLVLNFSSR